MTQPFRVDVPQAKLDAIRDRVAAYPWAAFPDAGGWGAGTGLADLRRLCDRWLGGYDWRATEERVNRLPQFTTGPASGGGPGLHYAQLRAGGDARRLPVLLLHGWPGSFLEFEVPAPRLAADGRDVVVPSLPGYGFSARPDRPIGPRRAAEHCHALMTDVLGYDRYLVQGGDWGAAIGGWIAHDHPEAVAGLHLNMVLLQAADAGPATDEERAWAAARRDTWEREGAYAHVQGTRPQSLAYAMLDSPVGVLAWIAEKFGAWSDLPRSADGAPDLWARWTEDRLLDAAMMYLVTDAFPTSTWLYRGRVTEGTGAFPAGSRVRVPTAVAAFPDPVFAPPPRSLAGRSYDLVRWTEPPRGGHFAALEEPELWLADVRAFADSVG